MGNPKKKNKRKYFIGQLIQKIKEIRGLLVCLGDWNCLWNRANKLGGQHIPSWELKETNNILDECRLADLRYEDPPFTWIKKLGENNYVKERLDRGEANIQWKLIFPEVVV